MDLDKDFKTAMNNAREIADKLKPRKNYVVLKENYLTPEISSLEVSLDDPTGEYLYYLELAKEIKGY